MSTTSLDEATDTRTYRGRTLEELLPKIREELGPDAVVVRQRDGLMGGVGGFFQQRFVEVEARAGARRVDVYDEEPTTPESFARLLAEAEDADPIVTAAAFAPPVGDSEPVAAVAPAEGIEGEAAGAAEQAEADEPGADQPSTDQPNADRAGGAGEDDSRDPARENRLAPRQDPPATPPALQAAGLTNAFAERLSQDAQAHELPFAQDERTATRRALARRMPTALPHRAGGLAVAFAGPGSTAAADALATTYVRAGRRAHMHATLEQARTRIERGAPDAVVALDLPPLSDDPAEVEQLADRLAAIELDETLLVIPAGSGLAAAQALLDRATPLAPTGLVLDCADRDAPLGAVVELACTTRLPIVYVLDRTGAAGTRIVPADPASLAERLLP